jgi:hypothetical protein
VGRHLGLESALEVQGRVLRYASCLLGCVFRPIVNSYSGST